MISAGLKSILGEVSQFNVVECTSDIACLIDRLPVTTPDLIIVDPLLVAASQRSLRTLVPDRSITVAAIVHSLFAEEQLSAFDLVISVCDSSQQIVHKLLAAVEQSGDESQSGCDLSEREREILLSVAQGMTNKEIADRYNLSIHTVISHRKNISHKTGIRSIAGLTVYAIMNNLISPAEAAFENDKF